MELGERSGRSERRARQPSHVNIRIFHGSSQSSSSGVHAIAQDIDCIKSRQQPRRITHGTLASHFPHLGKSLRPTLVHASPAHAVPVSRHHLATRFPFAFFFGTSVIVRSASPPSAPIQSTPNHPFNNKQRNAARFPGNWVSREQQRPQTQRGRGGETKGAGGGRTYWAAGSASACPPCPRP